MIDEIVLDARQLRCLAAPVSSQTLSVLRSLGEAPATIVAENLDRAPATALYHLRKLERVGLAAMIERRATARRPEAIYAPSARIFTLPSPASQVEDLVIKAVLAGVREAMRGFAAAAGRNHKHVLRCQMRLKEEDASHFVNLLEAASRFAIEHQCSSGGIRLGWSSLVYPEKGLR
jgi:predicted ArsR family transcriptional regulator